MIKPAQPFNEQERLQALLSLKILDTPPEESYDRHIRTLAQILDVPIAYVALIDANRQWLKSAVGPLPCELDRDAAFCGHTILKNQPLIIPDTTQDPRFAGNPLVTGEPFLRFYAGIPLRNAADFNVGTLCIADTAPRHLSAQDLEILQSFAALIEEKINRTPRIFISYSHQDEAWKDHLGNHLAVLKNQGLLDFWDDRKIDTGAGWRTEIQDAIEASNIAVLLISADFLKSPFILGEEVPRLLERRDKEGMTILPLIVKPCPWKHVAWLEPMNMFPKDAQPLACLADHEIDSQLTDFASWILARVRGVPPPSLPAAQPAAVAAPPVTPPAPQTTRPKSSKLFYASVAVFTILFLVTVGIISGIIEMQGTANAGEAGVEEEVAVGLDTLVALATAGETLVDAAAEPGARQVVQDKQQEPATRRPDPPPQDRDRTSTPPTAAQAGVAAVGAAAKPAQAEPQPREEEPRETEALQEEESPPASAWDEPGARQEIAALVERFRRNFQNEDVAGLQRSGIVVETILPDLRGFFRNVDDLSLTASHTPTFEGEQSARVAVTLSGRYDHKGADKTFTLKRRWTVRYDQGRWVLVHDEKGN